MYPVVVNGKTIVCTPDEEVYAYFVRIWCKARWYDELYAVEDVDGEKRLRGPLRDVDSVNIANGVVFELRRR